MNDPAPCGHPLHVARIDDSTVPYAISMFHHSTKDIGNGLNAPMGMQGNPLRKCFGFYNHMFLQFHGLGGKTPFGFLLRDFSQSFGLTFNSSSPVSECCVGLYEGEERQLMGLGTQVLQLRGCYYSPT
jgi:hypothetical protein